MAKHPRQGVVNIDSWRVADAGIPKAAAFANEINQGYHTRPLLDDPTDVDPDDPTLIGVYERGIYQIPLYLRGWGMAVMLTTTNANVLYYLNKPVGLDEDDDDAVEAALMDNANWKAFSQTSVPPATTTGFRITSSKDYDYDPDTPADETTVYWKTYDISGFDEDNNPFTITGDDAKFSTDLAEAGMVRYDRPYVKLDGTLGYVMGVEGTTAIEPALRSDAGEALTTILVTATDATQVDDKIQTRAKDGVTGEVRTFNWLFTIINFFVSLFGTTEDEYFDKFINMFRAGRGTDPTEGVDSITGKRVLMIDASRNILDPVANTTVLAALGVPEGDEDVGDTFNDDDFPDLAIINVGGALYYLDRSASSGDVEAPVGWWILISASDGGTGRPYERFVATGGQTDFVLSSDPGDAQILVTDGSLVVDPEESGNGYSLSGDTVTFDTGRTAGAVIVIYFLGGSSSSSPGGGSFAVASQSEVRTGTNNTKGLSPLRLRQELNVKAPQFAYNVLDYGAKGDYNFGTGTGTDDTAAFQAAIDAIVASNRNGIIYVPKTAGNAYLIDGNFDGTTFSQLVLPTRDTLTDQNITIAFMGEVSPFGMTGVLAVPTSTNNKEVIIYSKKRDTVNRFASILSGRGAGGGPSPGFTNVKCIATNVSFRSKWWTTGSPGPGVVALNFAYLSACEIRHCNFDTDLADLQNSAEATNTNAPAVVMPFNSNGGWSNISDCTFNGGAVGLLSGEHTDIDRCVFVAQKYTLVMSKGNHSVHVGKIGMFWCQNLIVDAQEVYGDDPTLAGLFGTSFLTVSQLDVEHLQDDTKWYATRRDVLDSRNHISGILTYHTVLTAAGPLDSWSKLGGNLLICQSLASVGRSFGRDVYNSSTLGPVVKKKKQYDRNGKYIGVTPIYYEPEDTNNLLNDLAAYWNFDEDDGTRYDSTSNGNHLSEVGSPSAATVFKINNGVLIGGSVGTLEIANNSFLNMHGKAGLTIAFWIRTPSTISNGSIITKNKLTINSREYQVMFDSGAIVFYKSANGTTFESVSTASLSPSTNYFIACRFNNTTGQMDISVNNGTPVVHMAATGIYNGTAKFIIGNADSFSYPGSFVIDELGVWEIAKSDDDITRLYNGGSGNTYSF